MQDKYKQTKTHSSPDNTDPTTLDGLDLSHRTQQCNDGGDKLGKAEGIEEGNRGMLYNEKSVRTNNEDESLQVNDGVVVVGAGSGGSTVLEVRTKCVVELVGLEGDGREGKVQTIGDGVGEDLGQVLAIGLHAARHG